MIKRKFFKKIYPVCFVSYFLSFIWFPSRYYHTPLFHQDDLLMLRVDLFTRRKRRTYQRRNNIKLTNWRRLEAKWEKNQNKISFNTTWNILPEPVFRFLGDVAFITCMSCWKFFSKVVSRDLMASSMLRVSWFALMIIVLSLFLAGARIVFDSVEALLPSTAKGTIAVRQDSHRINHMII